MKAAPRPKCDVGYFLRTYPRLSQTFIVNEILELERRGLKLAILGAWRPDDGLFHEAIGRVRTQADYLPETRWGLWVKTWRSILPHLRRMTPVGRRALAAAWLRRRVTTRQLLLALGVLRWVHKRKVRHVHVHFGGEEATVAFLAHLIGGLSYSVTLHAFDIFRDNVNPALLIAKTLAARFVVTVSEYNRRYLLERFPQLDPQRLHVCYNGIDLDRFCPAKVEREPDLVAAVGRLTEKKGFIHLLRALATLRQRGLAVRCALAGTGPDEARLRAEAKRLGLEDRIEWLGDVKQDDVRDLMRRAACLALPCIEAADGNMDALPTVLIESLACGCPTISTRLSGIPEIIEDGNSGILVPPGDEDALADAIERVIQDPTEAATLRDGGLQRVRERFDVRRQGAVLAELFRQMKRRTTPVTTPEESSLLPIEADPETESSCIAARVSG